MLAGTDGLRAIAVVGGSGDPAQWWDSVRRAIPPARDTATGLRHAHLADGLHAVAVPGASAATITVSSALDPASRRAAVRTAVRAARRAGWLPSRVPAFLFPLLPLLAWRPAAKLVTAKAAAVAMTGTAVVAGGAATFVFATGYLGGGRTPAADYDPPAKVVPYGLHAPAVQAGYVPQPRHQPHRYPLITQPPPEIRPQPLSSGSPQPMPSATTTTPASPPPSQSPGPSPTNAPGGTPAPSPQPTPQGSPGTCVTLLGVTVCVPV